MAESCDIQFRIIPHAKKSGLNFHSGEILKIKVTARAVDGKANIAVVDLLSEISGCPKRQIQILKGPKSQDKTIRLEGFSREQAIQLLLPKR